MTHSIVFDGRAYTISAEFATAVKKGLGTLSFNSVAVEQERKLLQQISNIRPLSAEQRQRLWFLDHVLNVLSAITVVGEHHDPVKEWGLDGWDAVHGQQQIVHCGCVKHGAACAGAPASDCRQPHRCILRQVCDHYSTSDNFGHGRMHYKETVAEDGTVETEQLYEPTVHPTEPWSSCELHKHLIHDYKAHQAQVLGDAAPKEN